MKKGKIINIIIIIIALVLISSGVVMLIIPSGDNKSASNTDLRLQPSKTKSGVEENDKKVIKICQNVNEDCMVLDLIYSHASLDTDIKEMQDFVTQLNQQIDTYYQETEKADINSSICKDQLIDKGYLKDSYVSTKLISYISDKYISLSMLSSKVNLCNNTVTENPYVIGFYDKEAKKMLTQEEIATKLNITKDKVYAKLQEASYDKNINEQVFQMPTIENLSYQLYLNENGKVEANCTISTSPTGNTYYVVTLD